MSRTILVVDDDPDLRLMLRGILEEEGYAVAVARDGLDALTIVDQALPDLILLDLSMPRMDGYAFAAELSRRDLRDSVPVMVLTADGNASHKAARLGADAYLPKPFLLDDLLAAVERLLTESPG